MVSVFCRFQDDARCGKIDWNFLRVSEIDFRAQSPENAGLFFMSRFQNFVFQLPLTIGFVTMVSAPMDCCAIQTGGPVFRTPLAGAPADSNSAQDDERKTPLDSIPQMDETGTSPADNSPATRRSSDIFTDQTGDSGSQGTDVPGAFFPLDDKLDLKPQVVIPAPLVSESGQSASNGSSDLNSNAVQGAEPAINKINDNTGMPQTIDGTIEEIGPGVAVGNDEVDQRADETAVQRPVYRGTAGTELVVQNYPDGNPMLRKEVALDADGNYHNHGRWEVLDRKQQRRASGQFREGKMVGAWYRWHEANEGGIFAEKPFNLFKGPFRSVAAFSGGKLDGTWAIFDSSGLKIFEIQYREGVRDGTATWLYPDQGNMRRANFVEGKLDGRLLEWDEQDKLVREEEYRSGRRVIRQSTWYRPEFKSSENSYLDGTLEFDGDDDWWKASPAPMRQTGERVQHGPANVWYPNRQPKMKGQYDEGNRVGRFVWWHENGLKQGEGVFVDGEKTGHWTWWHDSGRKSIEGRFEDDAEVGVWTWWNEDGSVRATENMELKNTDTNSEIGSSGKNASGSDSSGFKDVFENRPFEDTPTLNDSPVDASGIEQLIQTDENTSVLEQPGANAGSGDSDRFVDIEFTMDAVDEIENGSLSTGGVPEEIPSGVPVEDVVNPETSNSENPGN